MTCFPIFIDITDKKCLVIGGGKVALRKVETLLRYDAHVEVVGEHICPEIQNILPLENICERNMEEEDVEGAVLVVAATNSREVNHRISELCKCRNIPVNVVDAPEECTFLFPAVVKKGDISIGINTGGNSPLVSSRVRKKIEEVIPDYYGAVAAQLGKLRKYVKENFREEEKRRKILKKASEGAFRKERILSPEEIDTIIRQVLKT